MKKKILSILLCMVFLCTLSLPVYADSDSSSSDGYSAIISDIPTVCPTCGSALHASWRSTSGAEVELQISEAGKITIPAGAGVYAHFRLYCEKCGYSKSETRILGLDWGSEHPGSWEVKQAPSGIGRKDLPGYADDNGTPSVSSDGGIIWQPTWDDVIEDSLAIYYSYNWRGYLVDGYALKGFFTSDPYDTGTYIFTYKKGTSDAVVSVSSKNSSNPSSITTQGFQRTSLSFLAPIKGKYNLLASPYVYYSVSEKTYTYTASTSKTVIDVGAKLSPSEKDISWNNTPYSSPNFYWHIYLPKYKIVPYSAADKPTSSTNITINNNTWNGNIYVDNSTNLTYIYPQYTTINENNETVTNISTNPIIYNNETKQYYTYDTVTNNYYYITYETSPTPTPSPSPAPAPTWTPGGGATRGGGVGRHPSDTDAADWTLHYYILNNRRYDAYYALKKTEVDTETKLPWVDNKKYISTTQIPIANGQYTVSVPDGVYWRVWSWDEASQTLTGVNSSNWHSTINNFLFNATGEYIFEFCKADGSDFDTAKDVTLKLKNDKITDYEDGGTIVEEPTPSPSPEPTETPSPTEPPIPTATPTPGGGTVPTPGGGTSGGNSGNGSNISGGDDEGLFGWLWDLLKDLVKAILKAIFKVLSGILGFLIWLVERVGLLFPFLPAPAVAALGAGVVLVFVIKIIRFIRG